MKQSAAPARADAVTVITDPDEVASHLGSDKKTVVLFEMTGCPFCRMFQPEFQSFVEKRPNDCALLRVKLDEYDNPLWGKYGIAAVPTVIVFSGAEISSRADAVPGLGLSKKKWARLCAGI